MQKIIKEQTSYAVAADLLEMELKKILIEKMEGNKSIHRSNKQRNLYKAFVEAYESDKIILDIYGDTVTLKRRRDDDTDKDEEPSAGSDRGSKRPSESPTAEEPMQTTFKMEEPSHPEFETGADDQPIVKPSQHPEWFSQQKKPPTPDRDWNKTLPANHGSIQPWISDLAKQSDSRSSFNELMDTPTSNTLHNAIMEAGGKDRPLMCMENYKNVSQDIRDQLNAEAEAEAVQIILTRIDNDIYSTVDACPNACEMWKAIKRLKQSESSNVQDLETNLYWEFGKFTSRDGGSLESYYLRSQQAASRNRGKAIVKSPPPIYDQEPYMVAEDNEMLKDKEIDKLMALISLSFKRIYKPTNNNLRTSSNTSRANQDNSPRIDRGTGYENQRIGNVAGVRDTVARECQKMKRAKDAAYHKEKMLLCKQEEAGFQLSVKQADWRDDTDDKPEDQELEAHCMYMAQIQEVTSDAADNSRPIFDIEPLQKVPNNDNYNMFAIECEHPEQSKSVNDTYPIKQDEHNVIIDSLDMSYDREQIDQNDDDDGDLANERELLASSIEKLKCEIDDSKNRNKFLKTSNKVLVDKLKGEIEDFKTKNKSLESSNNYFKEANNKLSKINELMYKDLKKFQAELARYNDVKYASKVEIHCAKAKGDLLSYKMEFEKSSNVYNQKINDLNQTISDIKKELFAHQETISILSQQKKAQLKFYKTREDKQIDKVIVLENKIKD
nr:hypothetical protein [Tanacetum cinerariifolium]